VDGFGALLVLVASLARFLIIPLFLFFFFLKKKWSLCRSGGVAHDVTLASRRFAVLPLPALGRGRFLLRLTHFGSRTDISTARSRACASMCAARFLPSSTTAAADFSASAWLSLKTKIPLMVSVYTTRVAGPYARSSMFVRIQRSCGSVVSSAMRKTVMASCWLMRLSPYHPPNED
jgi:hypothetical protein